MKIIHEKLVFCDGEQANLVVFGTKCSDDESNS
jgi:hypothetical protein